jgi:hypothetical protein
VREVSEPKQTNDQDGKKKWILKMLKSAKAQYKLCPYFDKKTIQCFLMLTMKNKNSKCDRDGRFDTCPLFLEYLDKVYDNLNKNKKIMPNNFQDIVNTLI